MKRILTLLLLAVLCATSALAQAPESTPPPSSSGNKAGGAAKPAKPEAEHLITPTEARELFRSVDEILRFASKDTQFPIKHPVQKEMHSRSEVEKILNDKFETDADRIRFERSELVLKKFGLLPREFQLHEFLVKLLAEQVAGFYDEKTKKINLLNWVSLDMQKPVMAHELTHALQDQSFDMEAFRKRHEEIEKQGPGKDPNALVRTDDESTCFSAVAEGQAMIVLLDYILAPDRSVEQAPQVVDLMQAQMQKEKSGEVFESAPVLIKEELIFPYTYGMKFIRDLLVAGGKDLAFTGVMKRLPRTTREILEPKEYLAGRIVPTLLLPNMRFLDDQWEPFDAGSIGELDVKVLLKQYVDDATAARYAPEWRGGAYYAAGRKGVTPPNRNSTAHIGLLYVSRWSSDTVARQFAQVYASALQRRYQQVQPAAATSTRQKYETADGPVILEQHGDMLVIAESFDEATANKLIDAAVKQPQEQKEEKVKTSDSGRSPGPDQHRIPAAPVSAGTRSSQTQCSSTPSE
jgi:hypothetical protein